MDASSSGRSGESLIALRVTEFLERAGAAVPVPGGGGIAALAGAAAVSMLEMTLNFTVGKPKFAAVEQEARRLLAEVSAARIRLTALVDEDAAQYAKVSAAMKLPGKAPGEKEARKAAMNQAMREAIEPPLEMLGLLAKTAGIAGEILSICNPNLASDAGVAASIIPGAARAAALNVWMNVPALESAEARRVVSEVNVMLASLEQSCGAVSREVELRLCPKNAQGNSSQ